MTIGPLELLVISYQGSRVADEIGRELASIEHAGSIRLVDLAFITKDGEGVVVRKAGELGPEELGPFAGAVGDLMGLFEPEELERATREIPAGTAAVVALVEHTWATGLRDAVRRSGGLLVIDELLPREVVEEANAELAELETVGE